MAEPKEWKDLFEDPTRYTRIISRLDNLNMVILNYQHEFHERELYYDIDHDIERMLLILVSMENKVQAQFIDQLKSKLEAKQP